MDPGCMCFVLAQASFWLTALTKAGEYGLIAVLLVIVLRWVLIGLDRRIRELEILLQHVEGEIAQINNKWGLHIHSTSPLGVTNEQAKRLIEISLDRDLYRVMTYIAQQLLFSRNEEDSVLIEELTSKIQDVLCDTRNFLSGYRTSKGTLTEILKKCLPISGRHNGDEEGDAVFREIATRMVEELRKKGSTYQVKLAAISKMAKQRRDDTKNLLFQWLEGNGPMPHDGQHQPGGQTTGE